MYSFKVEEHWLTFIYVLSHVRLLINRKWKERKAMARRSRNRYHTVRCRCWNTVMESESFVSLSLLPTLMCPPSILAFHDMAAYELAGGSINLAILHELERHRILRSCTFRCLDDAEWTRRRSGGRPSLAYILIPHNLRASGHLYMRLFDRLITFFIHPNNWLRRLTLRYCSSTI
jgi:hypothetical protein